MDYYLSKVITGISFQEAENRVTEQLKAQGFGIVTQIDMQATLMTKIGKEIQPYKILGACNPAYAYNAISNDDKIGVMLPCNVCLQQLANGNVEVFTINPIVAMESVAKPSIKTLGKEIYDRLILMLEGL